MHAVLSKLQITTDIPIVDIEIRYQSVLLLQTIQVTNASEILQMKSVVLLISIFLTGCIDLASNDDKNTQNSPKTVSQSNAQVYTMRGGLGGIFSKGMNRLQDSLKQDHRIYVSSTVWYKSNELSHFIIDNYKKSAKHGPIILVGHSLGANEQIKVASSLERAHIPVALLMTVDAVSPKKVPSNVTHALNLYKPSFIPLFSGLTLEAIDPKHTRIDNVNVDALKGVTVNHFTIDGNPKIQKIMLDEVLMTVAKK